MISHVPGQMVRRAIGGERFASVTVTKTNLVSGLAGNQAASDLIQRRSMWFFHHHTQRPWALQLPRCARA